MEGTAECGEGVGGRGRGVAGRCRGVGGYQVLLDEDEFVEGRVSLVDGNLARCTIASSNKLFQYNGSCEHRHNHIPKDQSQLEGYLTISIQ